MRIDGPARRVFMGWEGVQAKLNGVELNAFYPQDFGVPYAYAPCLLAHPATLEEEPAMVRAFLAATARGYEWAAANADEVSLLGDVKLLMVVLRARWVTLRARWVGAESSLGDAKSSLGDVQAARVLVAGAKELNGFELDEPMVRLPASHCFSLSVSLTVAGCAANDVLREMLGSAGVVTCPAGCAEGCQQLPQRSSPFSLSLSLSRSLADVLICSHCVARASGGDWTGDGQPARDERGVSRRRRQVGPDGQEPMGPIPRLAV